MKKWLKCGQNKYNKNECYVPYGDDVNLVAGKTVCEIEVREDNEDIKISFEDGSELRIFGVAMLPSFSLRKTIQNEV